MHRQEISIEDIARVAGVTIGLVVTSVADPFFSDVVKGIEEVARTANFNVFLSASYNNSDQEMAIIESFHRRRVDGILISSSRISSNYKERLGRTRIPIVLVNITSCFIGLL